MALCVARERETATRAALAPKSGRLVPTSRGAVFVQDEGAPDGVPVVLVHGTAAWGEFGRGTIDALVAKGDRVIAIDVPPCGFSERPVQGTGKRDHRAARIVELFDGLGVIRPSLVGHAFGAGATVETTMRHGARTRGRVPIAPALGLPEGEAPPVPTGGGIVPTVLETLLIGEAIVAATVTNPWLTRYGLSLMLARTDPATDELATVLRRQMVLLHTSRDVARWLVDCIGVDFTARSLNLTSIGPCACRCD